MGLFLGQFFTLPKDRLLRGSLIKFYPIKGLTLIISGDLAKCRADRFVSQKPATDHYSGSLVLISQLTACN